MWHFFTKGLQKDVTFWVWNWERISYRNFCMQFEICLMNESLNKELLFSGNCDLDFNLKIAHEFSNFIIETSTKTRALHDLLWYEWICMGIYTNKLNKQQLGIAIG